MTEPAPPGPATRSSIAADLRRLGLQPGATVIVHASLSALGYVAGGAHAVVLALLDAVGPTGTVVVPTQTAHHTDPAQWQHPPVPAAWWAALRAETPAFDPAVTPSVQMGAVAELVRCWPGALRSDHPHVSFAAIGPGARAITARHQLAHGLGEGSPLARLYEADARVLLLGVGHESNTSLHLAEHRAGVRAPSTAAGTLVRDGVPRWESWPDIALDSDCLPAIGAACPGVREGAVAQGCGRLMAQRELVDAAQRWLSA